MLGERRAGGVALPLNCCRSSITDFDRFTGVFDALRARCVSGVAGWRTGARAATGDCEGTGDAARSVSSDIDVLGSAEGMGEGEGDCNTSAGASDGGAALCEAFDAALRGAAALLSLIHI